MEKPAAGSGRAGDGEGRYQARELGVTEENWTKAAAQGTGVVVFGIALKCIVDTELISIAAHKASSEDALFRAQIVAVAADKEKHVFQVAAQQAAAVEVRPWPELSPETADFSHFLTLPGDSSPDLELSKSLYWIVREELNTQFSSGRVLEFHVYYHKSEAQSIIAVRAHGAALDRQACSLFATSFLAALNAAVGMPSAVSAQSVNSDNIVVSIEDLIPAKYKGSSWLTATSMIGKSLNCSLLPFQASFGDRWKEGLRSGIVSHSLGKPGTKSLLALLETSKDVPLYAIVASAYLKASYTFWRQRPGNTGTSSPEFGFTSIVDCRPLLPGALPKSTVGALSVGIPLQKKVTSNEDLWSLARSISSTVDKSLKEDKHFSLLATMNGLFSKVLKHPNMTTGPSKRTSLFSIFTDTLHCDWGNTEHLNLAGTYGPFSSMHGPGPCFCIGETMLAAGPELCLSLIYPEPVYCRNQMEAVATSAIHLLRNLGAGNPNGGGS